MTARAASLGVASAVAVKPNRLEPAPRWSALLVALVLLVLPASRAFGADPPGHVVTRPAPSQQADVGIDRGTPRRALQSFLDAARDGDFTTAARCLDLRGHADPSQGPELAEQLSYVLYRRPPIDMTQVPDDPSAHDGQVTVDTFTVEDQEVPLVLTRVKFEDGVSRWVISRTTVRRIPDIAATVHSSAWEQRVPRALRGPVIVGNAPWQWLGMVLGLLVAYAVGRAAAAVCVRVARSFARRTITQVDDLLVEAARRPLRTIFASVLFGLLVDALQVSLAVAKVLRHVAYTGFILGVAWLLLAASGIVATRISASHTPGEELQPETAGARTRQAILQRVASVVIVCVAVALMLLQFDVVRHVGLSLLASAGIASVVVGLAAQKSLAGVIAGIQLSITQPIRLGDNVFIEGHDGIVQDIFLTYVVVRLWDGRSVVVPVSRFLDQPFQNWTLLRRDLTGFTLIHTSFTAPVDRLRAKVLELCEASPKWDRRRCEVQVDEPTDFALILRVTLTARTPADLWDLKCTVREGIYEYLRTLEPAARGG
jgi:small-conductance mechanosensitive channel